MTRKRVTDEQYADLRRRTDEFVRRVDEGTVPFDTAMGGLQLVIENHFGFTTEDKLFPILVDYGLSLEEMISAGQYDKVDLTINPEHFPVTGMGEQGAVIDLIRFSRPVTNEEALSEIKRMNLSPATLPQGLAFGAKYPAAQKLFPIALLGQIWRTSAGALGAPYLWGHEVTADRGSGGFRGLSLPWWEDGVWDIHFRFATIRDSRKNLHRS